MHIDGTLETWDEVERLQSHAPDDPDDGPELIFRGQGDAMWGLVPSILRVLSERGLTDPKNRDHVRQAVEAEDESFRFFHHVSRQQQIVWWAVAQHHGGAARALDWSLRIGVALYFAVSTHLDRDGSLFVLRQQVLRPPKHDPSHPLHVVYNSSLTPVLT